MRAEEEMNQTGERDSRAHHKVALALDAFAEQMRRQIVSDPASMAQVENLPEVAADEEAMTGEDSYISAGITLFFVWWRSHERAESQ